MRILIMHSKAVIGKVMACDQIRPPIYILRQSHGYVILWIILVFSARRSLKSRDIQTKIEGKAFLQWDIYFHQDKKCVILLLFQPWSKVWISSSQEAIIYWPSYIHTWNKFILIMVGWGISACINFLDYYRPWRVVLNYAADIKYQMISLNINFCYLMWNSKAYFNLIKCSMRKWCIGIISVKGLGIL